MQSIGGYFSLELANRGGFPHDDGILLNTGRNALEYIFYALADVKCLFVPYYTCDVVMEPINKLGIPFRYYHINERLELREDILLSDGEFLLYTNYFGIKDLYCKQLAVQYGSHLILDYAQAWFAEPQECAGTVFSPRKFVGIPDGGIAYCRKTVDVIEKDVSFDRCSHLLKRYDLGAGGGYEEFRINSVKLHNQPIMQMSELSRALLQSIDFNQVKVRRWHNFRLLHKALKKSNQLQIPDFSTFACPMVYPYFSSVVGLKKHLISNEIFVATYWPNVFSWNRPKDIEFQFADRCLALPVDQRYNEDDMYYIIQKIMLL